ncbi:hypothetical protein [Ornithinibacillus halotolerans]|uniref:YtzI protein n=1 Tax=Ornithinibacillus halotolerans TaxID=1274357 RepID=A0A916S7X7_9BACI|nr:hypothetical protein [Ornithinibacillus halotolerans]GGA87702.1 hypothetical protein GCM10008025_33070 [Ornithinibacillus halotolerans]
MVSVFITIITLLILIILLAIRANSLNDGIQYEEIQKTDDNDIN